MRRGGSAAIGLVLGAVAALVAAHPPRAQPPEAGGFSIRVTSPKQSSPMQRWQHPRLRGAGCRKAHDPAPALHHAESGDRAAEKGGIASIALSLSYTLDSQHPDVFRLKKGQF
jgi:hypothetical protein